MTISTYIIGENEDIFSSLARLDFPINKYAEQISIIGAKSKNNKIGIAQFGTSPNQLRLCIAPKTMSKNESAIVEYLKLAISIARKHRNHGTTFVDSCLFDFAFSNQDFSQKLSTLDDFVEFNYLAILETIQRFFTRHFPETRKTERVQLSQLEYDIDLIANISSVDKAAIHQIKTFKEPDSILATFTVLSINHFIKNKCGNISSPELVKRRALQVSAFLRRRFKINLKAVNIQKLYAKKTQSMFFSIAALPLHRALIKLTSTVSETGSQSGKNLPIENANAIFINPENIYQLFVYDTLLENLPNHHVKYEPKNIYSLSCPRNVSVDLEAKPDIVISSARDHRKKYVVDAKWKQPSSYSEIKFEDISKLGRDHQLVGARRSAIVYPRLPPNLIGEYTIDWGQQFSFNVIELPMAPTRFK